MKKTFFCAIALVGIISFAPQALAPEMHDTDRGKSPWAVDIEELTIENTMFRKTKWTGEYLQMTLMSIPTDGEIGGEVHPDNDQFIRVEKGTARILMGPSEENITFDKEVTGDWAVFIPAGYWHNLMNEGDTDVKLYSLYAPAEHAAGTVHRTFEESEKDHHHHH